MSCTNPKLAVRLPGLKKLKFLGRQIDNIADAEKLYGKENVFLIPCGKCSSCILSKRKEWSVRCVMESKYHTDNCFLTLTYDDAHLPDHVQKKDLQVFLRSLRDRMRSFSSEKIKYFACGEYGEQTLRPHYHLIIFGYFPKDAKYYCDTKSGQALFKSEEVDQLWSKGMCSVQTFSSNTAGYVAGYVNKKFDKNDGFLMMSTRPGLGAQYLKDHVKDIIKYNCVTDDFGCWKNVSAPRYFESIAKKLGFDFVLDLLKDERHEDIDRIVLAEMQAHNLSYKDQVPKLKESVFNNKLAKLKRSL